MTLRFTHLKIAGAVGAAALTVGSLTSPALAADHDLTYTCEQPLGATDATLNPGSIPTSLVAGQKLKRTMTLVVHLNALQTGTAATFGNSVNGTIKSNANTLPFSLTIPDTPIPQNPGDTMDATATGKGSVTATKAGTVNINAGKITAVLNLSGGDAGNQSLTQHCTAPSDGSQTMGTVTVTKDGSKTTTTASYNAKKDKATGTAKVKGKQFGLAGTGKVKFTLKKGTHTVASKSGKLNNKGVANVSFKGVKKAGKYSISAKFAGDGGLKGSKGKDTFKVS